MITVKITFAAVFIIQACYIVYRLKRKEKRYWGGNIHVRKLRSLNNIDTQGHDT